MGDFGAVPIREGDLLAGKYRVERVIGSGGMGIVVAARHEQLGQLVAIKLVRDEALNQGDTVERFLREARAAVQLRSEHVAKVLDVGKLASGAPYMVMEFLDGKDLGQVLNDDGPMALDTAVLMMLQACEAVAEAHAAGIVHRDLKPQNLFLTQTLSGSPRLKVLDFGVSKAMGLTKDGRGALTRTRAMLGSPLYMAPEQMRSSRDVDARVDVWALGVVLFELLTRRWPFEAESMPELCLKVVTESPQPLAEFRPDVPSAVAAIIERCLAKEPGGRFANATELANALEPFAPPLLSRVPAERSRTGDAASAPFVDMSRSTLSCADASEGLAGSIASGPTPAAWGSAPRPAAPERPRSRAIVPLVVTLVIGATVAIGVALARRGAASAQASAVPPSVAASAPPVAPSLGSAALVSPPPPAAVAPAVASDTATAATGSSESRPDSAPSSDRGAALAPKRDTIAASARPIVRSVATAATLARQPTAGPSSAGPSSAGPSNARHGAPDDDIPALR